MGSDGRRFTSFPFAARSGEKGVTGANSVIWGVLALVDVPDILDRAAALHPLGQACRHELVEVAVEHRRGAGALDAGAQILHQLIGLQHVGADLVAPADIGLGGIGGVDLRPARFFSSTS